MSGGAELLSALDQAGEHLARFVESLDEAAFHRRPAPDEWTAAEIAGHAAEFPGTFASQARRLADDPNAPLGRALDDPGRLAAVARLAGAGPQQAAAEIRSGIRGALETLRPISTEGWAVRGRHPSRGELSVTDIVDQLLVSHLRDHLAQARKAAGVS